MASKEPASQNDRQQSDVIDAELLDACRSGDSGSQQRLYELCHRQVFRLMVRMVGTQEAADLTQQVFLQLFRKLDQFSGHSRFQTWLYRLAANEALQHLRRQRRHSFHSLSNEPQDLRDSQERNAEHRELLETAMARVEPELRTIFLLRESEGLSYREIAEVVGVPEGTVGSRLNRARRELQQHLADLGWDVR